MLLVFLLSSPRVYAQFNRTVQQAQKLMRENKIDSAKILLNAEIKDAAYPKQKGLAYLQLARAYRHEQDYAKSLAALRAALQIFKSQKATPEIFLTYTGLAELYRYQRLYKNAGEYLNLCEEILRREEIPDSYVMRFYNRKAALFAEYTNNKDSALHYSKKSMELAERTGDRESLLVSLMEISGIQERKKNYAEAIRLSRKIIQIAKEEGSIQLQLDALVNLCRNLNLKENYRESIKASLEAFEFAEAHKMTFNQLLFADNLQVAYSKIGDYQNAYKYLRIRLALTEDYYAKLHDEKVVEYEKKFRLSEKQNQIDDNNKLLLLKEKELKTQTQNRYLILMVMIAVVIFAGILMYNTRLIRKKNSELRLASEENEFLVSETHHRINNNLQLISILIESELKKNPGNDDFSNRRIIAKIDSLGILHRHLYRKGDGRWIDLNEFLSEVWKNTEMLFAANGIEHSFEVASVLIPENRGMYIGLLVTELSINSLKHAFGDQQSKCIALKITTGENHLFFSYADNGQGTDNMPELNLVHKLCRQLRVEYTVDNARGFKFTFNMKI